MTLKRNRPAFGRARWFAAWPGPTLLAAALLSGTATFAWPADGGDVTIDNLMFKSLDGDAFTIAHVEFDNTNLSKPEIIQLLTPDTQPDDARALAQKLTADRIAIPSVDILGADGSKIHLGGLVASHVDTGKIATLDLAAIEASGTDKGGTLIVKSGALHLDGLNVAELLAEAGSPGASSAPNTLGGMTLSGLDIVAPDPDNAPGQSIHVAFGSIDVHNDYSGDTLKASQSKITGLLIEPSPGSDMGKTLAALGYAKFALTMSVGASYQAEAKTFALTDFTLDGLDMGSLGLSANFTDVEPALFGADNGGRLLAALGAGVAGVELKLANGGLFEKALAFYATQEGVTPDALRAQWLAVVGQTAPVMLGGSPAGLVLAAEVQRFIAEPKTLSIDIKAKAGALKAGDFMAISDLIAFAAKLDITAAANR
jgi:hypothetical protein